MSGSCRRPRSDSPTIPSWSRRSCSRLAINASSWSPASNTVAGVLIASKYPFSVLPESPVELGRVIAVVQQVERVILVNEPLEERARRSHAHQWSRQPLERPLHPPKMYGGALGLTSVEERWLLLELEMLSYFEDFRELNPDLIAQPASILTNVQYIRPSSRSYCRRFRSDKQPRSVENASSGCEEEDKKIVLIMELGREQLPCF